MPDETSEDGSDSLFYPDVAQFMPLRPRLHHRHAWVFRIPSDHTVCQGHSVMIQTLLGRSELDQEDSPT